jgi:4,4'-diaponeurosporenoate glycosyltransferase
MYPTGVGPLVEGWTKNFAGGATSTRPLTVLLVVAWLSGLLAAPFEPGPFGLVYLAYAAQLLVLLRRVGGFSPLTALLFPIPTAFFVLVFLRSVVRTFVRRSVTWRGRTIRT